MKTHSKSHRKYGGIAIPDEFLCPISHQIMIEPVSTTNLHHFDRSSIQPWLEAHGTCPLTRETMPKDIAGKYPLFPLPNLQKRIQDFIQMHRDDPEVKSNIPDSSNVTPQYVGKFVKLDDDLFDVFVEIELERNNQYFDPNEEPENRFMVIEDTGSDLTLEHEVSGARLENIDPNTITFVL